MTQCLRALTALLLCLGGVGSVWAGGSGLNVVVVANANSTNSLQLANYYCEQRQIPPQNVLRINWTGFNVEWTLTDCQNTLLTPLHAMLAARRLTNQIDYVVLSMDIPYRINSPGNGYNGSSSALFYGFKPDSRDPYTCPLAGNAANLYAGSETMFRSTYPFTPGSNSFLAMLITSSNLALAKQIVDSGTLSDGTFPTQTVVLAKTSDSARNIRHMLYDNAIFDARLLGNYSIRRTNTDNVANLGESFGFQFGSYLFNTAPTTFAPGAMADNLTSYGGMIFESTGQTTLLGVLAQGAAGSYGTIVEPCAYLEKFPTPQNYYYQGRGFNLAESYYQSITNPYEGIIVGEPLAAPFAVPCSGSWSNLASGSLLTGVTNLYVQFQAANTDHPVQKVDLFVDGTYSRQLAYVPPTLGNKLSILLNGRFTNYNVGSGASLQSVATAVVSKLSGFTYATATKVAAVARGDRIELRSTNILTEGNPITLYTTNDLGTGTNLTTFIRSASANFLDTPAAGMRRYQVSGILVSNDWLQLSVTKTNGSVVTVAVTNLQPSGFVGWIVGDLVNAINGTPALQGPDGVVAEDLYYTTTNLALFNIFARSPSWAAAQAQVAVTGTFTIMPSSGTLKLDQRVNDLQPRNHLYITAGSTDLVCQFSLDTTTLSDGWHELTAVAYEGSHVRTQTRVSQRVLIQNTDLSATLDCLMGGTNTALEATLQFAVTPNTNNIASIELFSTGGSWGVVSNQPTATFSIGATNLHIGLHPFYALVRDVNGVQYRTDTQWVRIVGAEQPIMLTIGGDFPTLIWPATAGRSYQVWSTTNIGDAFLWRDTLAPTSSLGLWPEPDLSPPQQFYRVVSP